MIDCKATGILENCEIHNSDLTNAHIRECTVHNCRIENSRVRNVVSDRDTIIMNSYVFGNKSIHSATIEGGFFASGSITKFNKFKDCEIFKFDKIKE
jgi:hypothetical protein